MGYTFDIGGVLFYKQVASSKLNVLGKYFKFESGRFILDSSKINGNVDEVSKDIARLLDADWLEVKDAVKKAIILEEQQKEAELKKRLKNLLEVGVFAVAPSTQVNENVASRIFSRRGDLYYLDMDKLTEEIVRKKIVRREDVVSLVKSVMDLSGLKYFDFHLDILDRYDLKIFPHLYPFR